MFRFAVIGAGNIAHKFCDAVQMLSDAEISAVGSKSAARAEKFAAEEGIPLFFDNYEKMLDSVKPDGVYIATTHNFHQENIKLCLNRGIPVICEKPMVLCSADAKELFALAEEKGVLLMEAMWSRYLPQIQKAREWIAEGRIGTIRLASGVVGFYGERDPHNRVFSRELAGGALYDIGVYTIELASYLIGQKLLETQFTAVMTDTGVDGSNLISLRFESCTAALQTTVMASPYQHLTINGEKGYIVIPNSNVGDEAYLYENGVLTEHFQKPYENGFYWEAEEFVSLVREGKTGSAVVPAAATLECAGIFDLANEKMEQLNKEG